MLNQVQITGRLGQEPEVRYTGSGTPVVSVNIAVERDYKAKDTGKRQVDWLPVTAWRNTAEFLRKYFHKGDGVTVVGRLQARTWETDSGEKRKAVEIVAENVYFPVGGHRDGQYAPPERTSPAGEPVDVQAAAGEFTEMDDYDADLPF